MDLDKAVKEKIVMDAAVAVLTKMSEDDLRPLFVAGIVKGIENAVGAYAIRQKISEMIAEKAMTILKEKEFQRKIKEQARKLSQEYIDKCYGPAAKSLEWAAKEKVFEKD